MDIVIVYSNEELLESVPVVGEALRTVGLEYRILKRSENPLGIEVIYKFIPSTNKYKVKYTLEYLKKSRTIVGFYSKKDFTS